MKYDSPEKYTRAERHAALIPAALIDRCKGAPCISIPVGSMTGRLYPSFGFKLSDITEEHIDLCRPELEESVFVGLDEDDGIPYIGW